MRRFTVVVSTWVIGSMVTACDSNPRLDPAHTPSAAWSDDEEWTLHEVARLGVIGGAEGDPQQFGSIASVAMDSRDRIYVLDDQAQEIRVFTRSGEFSHSIGRPGSGPGEFEFAQSMVLSPGDTLVVRDDGAMRYSVFDPDGELISTHRRGIVGTNPGASPAWVNGQYVDWGLLTPDGRFGARFSLLPIAYRLDFSVADTLSPIEHEWAMLPSGMPMTYYVGVPLGALSAAGYVWVANSETYEVHRRTLHGDTVATAQLALDPLPVGPDETNDLTDRLSGSPDYLEDILQALPETQPPLVALASDSAGYLFTLPNLPDRGFGTALDVFTPNGEFLGSVEVPGDDPVASRDGERLRVYRDHVVLVRRDALDVEYVTVYELRRPSDRDGVS